MCDGSAKSQVIDWTTCNRDHQLANPSTKLNVQTTEACLFPISNGQFYVVSDHTSTETFPVSLASMFGIYPNAVSILIYSSLHRLSLLTQQNYYTASAAVPATGSAVFSGAVYPIFSAKVLMRFWIF